MSRHHSHPYFTQLPTMRNRQDLAFALDRLPSILAEYLQERQQQQSQQRRHGQVQQEHSESQCTYPSPPPSPRSGATVVEMSVPGQRGRSLSFSSVTSLSSSASSSSTFSSSSLSLFSSCSSASTNSFESRRRRRQHRLIEKNLVPSADLQPQQQQQCYAPLFPFRLQFRNRAQAMAFLMQLLKTMQISPEEQDEHQHQHQQQQQQQHEQEREQGLVPCYVCGEWYPEQVALYDQETGHFLRIVDGKSWHEQLPSSKGEESFTSSSSSSSWQHWNAEQRVRTWLDQVVVVIAAVVAGHPSKVQAMREEQEKTTMITPTTTTAIIPREDRRQLQETVSRPASYMIPEEILDPSCRSPGFRIKNKATTTTTTTAAPEKTAPAIPSPPASPRSSLQFTFTSERFRAAVQEASQTPSAKPIPAAMATSFEEETSASQEMEQDEKEEVQHTFSQESMVEETSQWSSDDKDASTLSQPETVLPAWSPSPKASKKSKGPWLFVRVTWRLTRHALTRPFAKSSKKASTH